MNGDKYDDMEFGNASLAQTRAMAFPHLYTKTELRAMLKGKPVMLAEALHQRAISGGETANFNCEPTK